MIDDLQSDDFKGMVYPIFGLKLEDKVLDKFPLLSKYKEFRLPDKLLRYVIFCYDRGSPLHREDNMLAKKVQAAILAGFKRDGSGKFDQPVVDVFNCKDIEANKAIIRFCRLQHNREYSLFVAGNEAYHNTLIQLLSQADKGDDVLDQAKTKMELLKRATTTSRELDDLYLKIFAGDTTSELARTAEDIMDAEEINNALLSPEDLANESM